MKFCLLFVLLLNCFTNSQKVKCNELKDSELNEFCKPFLALSYKNEEVRNGLLLRCARVVLEKKECNKESPVLP